MTYIGSDIVSLILEENTKSFSSGKYLSKILLPQELKQLTKKGLHPALFWSCKESAYKILLKKGYSYAFSPRIFEVNDIIFKDKGFYQSVVFVEGERFICNTTINMDYVFTYVIYNKIENCSVQNVTWVDPKPDTIKTYISKYFPTSSFFKSNKNIPVLIDENILDISISHDGRHYLLSLVKSIA